MASRKVSKAPETRLTLRRAGQFVCHVKGPNHCGLGQGPIVIQYQVEVRCAVSLDDRGFLFDQLTIQRYFEELNDTTLSCEQLTIECARNLFVRIRRENGGCVVLGMDVQLSPAPHAASMTFTYEAK